MMKSDRSPNRREFMAGMSGGAVSAAMMAAAAPVAQATQDSAPGTPAAPVPDEKPPLLDSPPVLQNPTDRSITIAWAVRGPATGWVEYGETPQFGQIARTDRHGLRPFTDRFLSARIEDLKPGQKVFYRVAVAPIQFHNAYKIERGETIHGEIHSFTTPNAAAPEGSFAIINDTHENKATLTSLMKQIKEQPCDVTIWNGDIFNDIYTVDQIVEQVLRPAGSAYAVSQPVLFTNGNHDVRGPLARQLDEAITPWEGGQVPGLNGRCFARRFGPVAIIGLDTGEDKPDHHPVFAGLASFEPYRKAQRDLLALSLDHPDIAAAPYLVVVCHIPLWGRPGHNGGDTLQGYAAYCKQAQELWHPLLKRAKAQIVISGHMHQYRVDAPTEDRPYPQVVGGGPRPEIATLIRGHATGENMTITAGKLDGTELGRWVFKPRG